MKKILLKTTIPHSDDDWNITSFSMLIQQLNDLTDNAGQPLFVVEARDRITDGHGNDPDLLSLPEADVDQLWLFALEVGSGMLHDPNARHDTETYFKNIALWLAG